MISSIPEKNILPFDSVVILEACSGPDRHRWLEERLSEMAASGCRTFLLAGDFALGGPWSGIEQLFSALMPEIQKSRPELVQKHDLELVYVLPQLRRVLNVRNPTLTDLAPRDERVRNYAADRAMRVIHGLIDLLDSWKTAICPDIPWAIACDSYDSAGNMSRLFFRELLRRKGDHLRLHFLFGVEAGKGEEIQAYLRANFRSKIIPAAFSPVAPNDLPPETAAQQANELEARLGDEPVEVQANLPALIQLWSWAQRPDKVVQYRFFALEVYNTLGLYEDALHYGDGLLEMARKHAPENERMQWLIVLKLLMSNMGLQKVEPSLELAENEGIKMAGNNADRLVRIYFLIAMLHARFKKPRDFSKGEEYLDRALAVIQTGKLGQDNTHFHTVFNRNGLAMVRNFQGRSEEAIELCKKGIEQLNAHLAADKHRLHRSVLLYNIAQVYRATNSHHEAIEYYSNAIEMDPNYSEYYNERGSIYLQLNMLEEAKADYDKAIDLSPPYFEVFTNLGQCYRKMGAPEDAIQSYSRALDIEPDQTLALLGRAKSYENLGRADLALSDYNAALVKDDTLWDALASRAVIHYESGNLLASVADLDRAIALKEDELALFQNRAIVLMDLGRYGEAADDLERGLLLNPTEEDRQDMKARLQQAKLSCTSQAASTGAA